MKTLNKISINDLKQMSDNDTVGYFSARRILPEENFGNSYNSNEFSPNTFQFYLDYENNEFGLVALHLGGDVRGNYSDYYVVDYDDAHDLISDKLCLEIEDEKDITNLTDWLLANCYSYVIDLYTIKIGDQITIDCGNSLELFLTPKLEETEHYIDLGCSTSQQCDLVNSLSINY